MAYGTRTVFPREQNKGLSLTFQPPEEGWSIQQPKCCDKHGKEDEDNSPKNVNNVHNTSSRKYKQINVNVDKSPGFPFSFKNHLLMFVYILCCCLHRPLHSDFKIGWCFMIHQH